MHCWLDCSNFKHLGLGFVVEAFLAMADHELQRLARILVAHSAALTAPSERLGRFAHNRISLLDGFDPEKCRVETASIRTNGYSDGVFHKRGIVTSLHP